MLLTRKKVTQMPDGSSGDSKAVAGSKRRVLQRRRAAEPATTAATEPEPEIITTSGDAAEGKKQGPINEDETVPKGLVQPKQKKPDEDREGRVRTWLAVALTALLFGLAGLAAYGWMWGGKTEDDLKAYMLIMSPIITLTGPILGFYFSSRRK